MEVGRRVGVGFDGIGMPGHFLVRPTGSPAVLLDPFHGGRSISRDDAERLYQMIHGPGAEFSADVLAPVPPQAILTRMLFNLRNSYRGLGDAGGLVWVVRLLTAMPAVGAGEALESAQLLGEVGRFADAAAVLETLADRVQEDEDERRLRGRAAALRARLN
jgi:regulator of sirC expression with transglutaminase-like and TPR domain